MENFRETLWTIWRTMYRSLWVLINNLYCIPTYVVWCCLFHPVYYLFPDLYWKMEGHFFHWLLTMVAYWSYSAGYHIVETGDSIESLISEETLVLVNHQSTSDVPLLMYAFCARRNLLEQLNWIMDAVFQYTNFGIVSTLHGDFFINAGRDKRDASLKDLENYLKTKFLPKKRKWLVLFPEGGFLRKRKEASKRYAKKMNLPNLEHVTLPRLGALQTIINTLAPAVKSTVSNMSHGSGAGDADIATFNPPPQIGKLKYIIDMTIAYPKGEPLDLGSVITGSVPPCQVRMHYKIYPIAEVPFQDAEEMQTWLYNIYIEKNNMLGNYYKTGVWSPNYAKFDINQVKSEEKISDSVCNTNSLGKHCAGSDVVDEAPRSSPIVFDDNNPSIHVTKKRKGSIDMEFEAKVPSITEDESNFNSLSEEDRNQFPAKEKTIHLDLLRIAILHAMFIASTMLHITAFRMLYHLF